MLKESWHKFRFPIAQFKEESKDLCDDIKCQVVEEIKTTLFGLFAIQIDESTYVHLFVCTVNGVCKICPQ